MSTAEFFQSYLESFGTDGNSLWVKAVKVMAIPEAIEVKESKEGSKLLFKDGSCLYVGKNFSYVID